MACGARLLVFRTVQEPFEVHVSFLLVSKPLGLQLVSKVADREKYDK